MAWRSGAPRLRPPCTISAEEVHRGAGVGPAVRVSVLRGQGVGPPTVKVSFRPGVRILKRGDTRGYRRGGKGAHFGALPRGEHLHQQAVQHERSDSVHSEQHSQRPQPQRDHIDDQKALRRPGGISIEDFFHSELFRGLEQELK